MLFVAYSVCDLVLSKVEKLADVIRNVLASSMTMRKQTRARHWALQHSTGVMLIIWDQQHLRNILSVPIVHVSPSVCIQCCDNHQARMMINRSEGPQPNHCHV